LPSANFLLYFVRMLSSKEIKWIISLKNKKYRYIHRAFIAEGPKLVNDLLINGLKPIKILKVADYLADFTAFNDKVVVVEPSVLQKVSCLQTAHQVLALFEMPDDSNMVHHPVGEWGIALDFIQDPGNLGTIIRTMNFLGIQHIYCSEDSVDVYNPKVVQASMGAIGRVKVSYVDLPTFLIGQPFPVYVTDMLGQSIAMLKLQPGVIVFGNEGNGVRPILKEQIQQHISIPKYGEGESLNLAIATAIVGGWIKMKENG
jgi:TrmH family RNA methyltransferase